MFMLEFRQLLAIRKKLGFKESGGTEKAWDCSSSALCDL